MTFVTLAKFVPVMVTQLPTMPLDGVKLVTVGMPGRTLKTVPLLPVPPAVTTVIGPLVAPAGTVVVMEVDVLVPMVAEVPLK